MRLIAEAVICIVLMIINVNAVKSKYEDRVGVSMMCMSLAIIVADLM